MFPSTNHTSPGIVVAVLIGGVASVFAAVVALAFDTTDLVLAVAVVMLLIAAAAVTTMLFRLLRDDGD